MKKQIIIIILLFFSSSAQTQITIAIAKDRSHSVLDYKVEWGYGYSSESTVQAAKYLYLKGYTKKDIYEQTCLTECGHDIVAGFYVVVKSKFKESDGSLKTGIGLGASLSSYEEATTRAVKNLTINNWSWKKSDGYQIAEKGWYDNVPKYQFIYIIWKKSTESCGIQTEKITRNIGTFDNVIIGKMEKALQSNAKKQNRPPAEVFHFIISTPFIGIIKERKYCIADKQYYDTYSIIQANNKEEIYSSVKPSEFQSQESEKSVFECISTQDENKSHFNHGYFLKTLEEILGTESPVIKQLRREGTGVRG